MARVGGKGTIQTWVFSKITLVVLLVMCLYVGWSVFERYTVERDMAERRAGLEVEYQALEDRKNTIAEKVDYLRGDSGRESEIRKHFDVAGEDEQVVIIVDDEPDNAIVFNEGVAPEVNAETAPWWQFWR